VNKVGVFDYSPKSQVTNTEITSANWPRNENYTYDESKLQLNSSLTWFMCAPSYESFLLKLNSIEWMKTIAKLTDKLALKGGAILDLLSDRKPKDYDFMNLGMSNEEFVQFLTKFNRETKPTSIKFLSTRMNVFRVTMRNGDLLEFVLNVDTTRERLFSETFLPDQIAFLPRENKLLANEYTLWSLSYGYCGLEFENCPRAIRLSERINKLGFNFFYSEPVVNNTPFLKGRLERLVWSISPFVRESRGGSSRGSCDDDDSADNGAEEWRDVEIAVGVLYAKEEGREGKGSRLFTSDEEALGYVKKRIEEGAANGKNENVLIDLIKALILSQRRNPSLGMFNGIDWQF
jgi:hypothetical protein